MFSAHSRAGKPGSFSRIGPASRRGPRPGPRGTPPPRRRRASHQPAGEVPPPLGPNPRLAAFDHHLVAAQFDVGKGQASSGRHVILKVAPGTGDSLALVVRRELPVVLLARLGCQSSSSSRIGDPSGAAYVGQAAELSRDIEDPDLTPADPNHLVTTLREIRDIPHNMFSELFRHQRFRWLSWASILQRRRAFSPNALRLTSLEKGTWCTFIE